MRFTNGRRGGPAAGFVKGPTITRTRPTAVVVTQDPVAGTFASSLRAKLVHAPDVDSIMISGTAMPSIGTISTQFEPFSPAIASSSIMIEGSICFGRGYERRKLSSILLGKPAAATEGPPFPSPIVMDVGPTGNFVSPSWTNSAVSGNSQAFVIRPFGANDSSFSTQVGNRFVSGVEKLEASSVPASGALIFSKEQRLQTITVKKSASFFDTVVNQFNSSSRGGRFSPPAVFFPGSGTLVSSLAVPPFSALPSFTGSTVDHPAVITLDVPVRGRLVDIKVWIEVRHDSSSVLSGLSHVKSSPLGTFGIALRSPNLSWGHAHPIRNDPVLKPILTGSFFAFEEFYRDSFLLWEGAGLYGVMQFVEGNIGSQFTLTVNADSPAAGSNGNPVWFSKFASWDRDLDMRTVFSDSAPVLNPRMNYSSTVSGNFVGAPNAGLGINSPWGLSVSWTGTAGSPPAGWISGLGGQAGVNEWPTTGSNVGAAALRPIYPLLAPVVQTLNLSPGVDYPITLNQYPDSPVNWKSVRGFRPGLRGTEISGTWLLMFAQGAEQVDECFKAWFRQARLEITYETGMPGERLLRRAPPSLPAEQRIYSISGVLPNRLQLPISSSLNLYVTAPGPAALFRSYGIAANSGAVNRTNALLYRLSGGLADAVGSSTPSWLFSGPFGMPVVPESSATLVPLVQQSIASASPSGFLEPRRTLDLPQRLRDLASDQNPPATLRQLADRFVSASAT